MLIRTRKRPTRLEAELALALEVASKLNIEKVFEGWSGNVFVYRVYIPYH